LEDKGDDAIEAENGGHGQVCRAFCTIKEKEKNWLEHNSPAIFPRTWLSGVGAAELIPFAIGQNGYADRHEHRRNYKNENAAAQAMNDPGTGTCCLRVTQCASLRVRQAAQEQRREQAH
jgi:hypothetical protein